MPPQKKGKRSLFNSPFSAKKDLKKSRTDNSDEDGESSSMEKEENVREKVSMFDAHSIHEAVATRINEALKAFSSREDSDPALKALPAFATAVSLAMVEVMKEVMEKLDERLERIEYRDTAPSCGGHQKLESAIRGLTFENDRLQQYTRRESVRIFGLPQEEGETAERVEEKALRVMKDAGVEVRPEDIAACHRAGKAGKGHRAVLVRFVSRRKRRELMTKKKTLKGKAGYERVFINDDLTPLRSRLLGLVKSLPVVERAWTTDGTIHCRKKSIPGLHPEDRPRPVTIETPDDLFHLGVTEVDYERLGLTHLVFAGPRNMD